MHFYALFMIVKMRSLPLANGHPEGPASYIWWSGGTGLLQMVIWRDRPFANDHSERPASCKWWSGGTGLLQMIIRRAAAVRGGIGDSTSCIWKLTFFCVKSLSEQIWVSFCRTGKMSQICLKKIFFGAPLWPNGSTDSTFLNCSDEILPGRFKEYFLKRFHFFGLALLTDFTPNRRFFAYFEVGLQPSCN